MQLGLAAWHRYMRSNDPELLAELVADDAVFYSPVVHAAQTGKAKVLTYLLAAGKVLGNDSFRYVRELVDGPEAMLEFEVEIDSILINGIGHAPGTYPILLIHRCKEIFVGLGILHFVEQEFHRIDRAHLHENTPQHPHL